jgi:hypothetical protein
MLPSEDDAVIGGNCRKCGGSFIDCNCKEDKQPSWTDVINDFAKSNYGVSESQLDFYEWLNLYYNPPTKKQKQ